MTERVTTAWRRIETWMAANFPEGLAALAPPADESAIAALEEKIGLELPHEVKAVYRIHDGDLQEAEAGLLGGWDEFLSIAQVGEMWDMSLQIGEYMGQSKDEFAAWKNRVEEGIIGIKGPVKALEFSPRWVPVTCMNGDVYRYLDFDPAPGGTIGQVIEVDPEGCTHQVIADSLVEFLEDLANRMEQGRFGQGAQLEAEDFAAWGMPDYLKDVTVETLVPGTPSDDPDLGDLESGREYTIVGRMGFLMGGSESIFVLHTESGRDYSFFANSDTRGFGAIGTGQCALVKAVPFDDPSLSKIVQGGFTEPPDFLAVEYRMLVDPEVDDDADDADDDMDIGDLLGSLLDGFQQPPEDGADFAQNVLQQLDEDGIEVEDGMELRVSVFFDGERQARAFAANRRLGAYERTVAQDEDDDWVCHVAGSVELDAQHLSSFGDLLLDIAEQHGGEFAGWEVRSALDEQQMHEMARHLLDSLRSTFAEEHHLSRAEPADFDHLDLDFYARTQRTLEHFGFEMIGDMEDETVSAEGQIVTFFRCMRHPETQAIAAFYYVPMLEDPEICELETFMSDGSCVVTTVTPPSNAFADYPDAPTSYHPPSTTTLVELCRRHEENVARHREDRPDTEPRVVASFDELVDAQHQLFRIKRDHLRSIGWITEEYLLQQTDGDRQLAEGVAKAVRAILAEEGS